MKLTYDPSVDAAYIKIDEEHDSSSHGFTHACDPKEVGGLIHLDFDLNGRLIGIEVLEASQKLPKSLFSD